MSKPILLMTRPKVASKRFVALLDPQAVANAEIIYAPLIQISPTNDAPSFDALESAIFTSSNAVGFAPVGAGRAAYVVGERTAARARKKGWQVKLCAQDADQLIARMTGMGEIGPLIHLAGRYRRGDIAGRLKMAGLGVRVHELYVQNLLPFGPQALACLSGEATVIVPLFSPRTAGQFETQARGASNLRILAMSKAVADVLDGAYAGKVYVIPAPTVDEMRRGVEKLLCDDSSP